MFGFYDKNSVIIPINAKSYTPKQTINFALTETSSGKVVSADRGQSTDRYSTQLVFHGSPEYINSVEIALTELRSSSIETVFTEIPVRIFGDNVNHSSNINTLVGSISEINRVGKNSSEITVEFLATDLTFYPDSGLPTEFACLQNSWSSFSDWNVRINETYNRDNYLVDRENDRYTFTGSYIMDLSQNAKLMQFWKTQRGAPFAITDTDFGTTEMFGAVAGNGTHSVIILKHSYVNISPTHRRVTIDLLKVG